MQRQLNRLERPPMTRAEYIAKVAMDSIMARRPYTEVKAEILAGLKGHDGDHQHIVLTAILGLAFLAMDNGLDEATGLNLAADAIDDMNA